MPFCFTLVLSTEHLRVFNAGTVEVTYVKLNLQRITSFYSHALNSTDKSSLTLHKPLHCQTVAQDTPNLSKHLTWLDFIHRCCDDFWHKAARCCVIVRAHLRDTLSKSVEIQTMPTPMALCVHIMADYISSPWRWRTVNTSAFGSAVESISVVLLAPGDCRPSPKAVLLACYCTTAATSAGYLTGLAVHCTMILQIK